MGRILRLPASIALSALAAATACSLTSLDGLSGGAAQDAGATADASTDGARVDGAILSDAEAGPPVAFCASLDAAALALCADFDQGVLPAPFGRVLEENGGKVTLDTADSRSPPRSLLFTVGQSNSNSAAALAWTSRPIATEVSFDLDVRVDAFGSGSFDVLGLTRAGVETGLQIRSDGALEFDIELPDGDGGQKETIIPIAGSIDSAWRHVRFEASPQSSSTWKVNVLVDGTFFGTTTVPTAGFVGQPDVVLGDDVVFPSSTPWRVHIDNVVVRAK